MNIKETRPRKDKSANWLSVEPQSLLDIILQLATQPLPPCEVTPLHSWSALEAALLSFNTRSNTDWKLFSLTKTITSLRYTQLPRSMKTKEKEPVHSFMSSLIYLGNGKLMTWCPLHFVAGLNTDRPARLTVNFNAPSLNPQWSVTLREQQDSSLSDVIAAICWDLW